MATAAEVDGGADVEIVGLRRAGFTAVDLIEGWLPLPDVTSTELDDLGSVLTESGLRARGPNVSRCSVIDPEQDAEFLEYTLRTRRCPRPPDQRRAVRGQPGCTAADVERLVSTVAAPNPGVNADLGNTYHERLVEDLRDVRLGSAP